MTKDQIAELKRLAVAGVCDCDHAHCVCELVALQRSIVIALDERHVMLSALQRALKHLSGTRLAEKARQQVESAIACAESSYPAQ